MLLMAVMIVVIGLAAMVAGQSMLKSDRLALQIAGILLAIAGACVIAFFGMTAIMTELMRS